MEFLFLIGGGLGLYFYLNFYSPGKGPKEEITPGSLMTARVIVREQSPFSLIIPALRKALEP